MPFWLGLGEAVNGVHHEDLITLSAADSIPTGNSSPALLKFVVDQDLFAVRQFVNSP